MAFWERLLIAVVVFAVFALVARLVDWRLKSHPLPPEAATRYRVLRRTISVTILVVGFFSALLVLPQVKAVAGGLLASTAVIGVVIGFAAQRTLGNFIAGLMIAMTQPVRLGDRVTYAGQDGIVEEIALMYTFIRADDGARLVVPNEKLASDTILNSTIRSRESFAEINVPIPLSIDLGAAIDGLHEELAGERDAMVYVSSLDANATLTLRVAAPTADAAQVLERDLRVRAHRRLRALGVWE
jgi:small-conductance mechanosensitive channel